jgi:hypothetical protein
MLCIKIEELQTVLRFAAGSWSTPEFLVGIGLFLAMVVGIVQQQSRIRSTRRLLAAADAYAEREIAQDPRIPAREFLASFMTG